MGDAGDEAVVTVDEGAGRYVVLVDGERAGHLAFTDRGRRRIVTHTEVAERFGGRGLAGRLVEAVVRDVEASDLLVVPLCPYAAHWLEEHPEHRDVVSDDAGDFLEEQA